MPLRAAALAVGDTLAANVRASPLSDASHSPWPFRVWAQDGVVEENYTSNVQALLIDLRTRASHTLDHKPWAGAKPYGRVAGHVAFSQVALLVPDTLLDQCASLDCDAQVKLRTSGAATDEKWMPSGKTMPDGKTMPRR